MRYTVSSLVSVAIEAIEATRWPAITPAPSYFRASAGRRPLSSGREVELEELAWLVVRSAVYSPRRGGASFGLGSVYAACVPEVVKCAV